MTAGAPKVFISYRREETAGHAGRLYDVMSTRFGESNVFMDVDIAPGVDFVHRITEAVGECHVLLVIMGPRWATISNGGSLGRIFQPGDFVRLEVETGIGRSDVAVIPVLVGGAKMPDPTALPAPLRALTRRNAIELSDTRWRYDVDRLLGALDGLLADTSAVHQRPPPITPPAGTPAAAWTPVPAPEPREPRIPGGGAAVVLGTTLVGAMAALIARGAADTLRRPRDTDLGKVLQPVALQALTWAVVGAAVAMWLALLLGPRRAWLGRVFAGAFTGAVAGAGSAAIGNGPRYLIHPTPADSTIKLLTVVGLGVTGALIGALVGWAWRRRASVGLSAGLVAGVLLKLVLNGSDWGGSRSATACLEAAVIIGSAAASLALLDAREGASSRAPASVGGR